MVVKIKNKKRKKKKKKSQSFQKEAVKQLQTQRNQTDLPDLLLAIQMHKENKPIFSM